MAITNKQREAARLIADGKLSDVKIAAEIRCNRQTLINWKKKPEFAELVNEFRMEHHRATSRLVAAQRHERMKILDGLIADLLAVKAARQAAYADLADEPAEHGMGEPRAPGVETGLLVPTWSAIGHGANPKIVQTWKSDGLIAELRALLEHSAREMGQWPANDAQGDQAPVRRYVGVDVDAV